MSGTLFSMDELASAIRSALRVPVVVEMTGGGVATMYVGEPMGDPESDAGARYPVVLGPGTFGYGVHPSWGNWGDFCIGPDDDGSGDVVYTEEDWDIARVVETVVENFERWRQATRDYVRTVPTFTVGDLRRMLEGYADDVPVIVTVTETGQAFNVIGVDAELDGNPIADVVGVVTLEAVDNYDPRQW
jgi:hypothetical protein